MKDIIISYLRGLYASDWLDDKEVTHGEWYEGYMDCVTDLLTLFDDEFQPPRPIEDIDEVLEYIEFREGIDKNKNMTEEEKEICKKYSAIDEDGYTHCSECPLVIDAKTFFCKAADDYEEVEERGKDVYN